MKQILSPHLQVLGLLMHRHRRPIQMLQWGIVFVYLFLLITPAFYDLPPRGAHIFNNLTLFAQFTFWGLWWPFVILSMLVLGRTWCGIFCPEGALAEWASTTMGRNKTIPRWLKWRGWPCAAFILTTLYGQLISVYDYAWPTLLILGGSTMAAMIIGVLYGKGTRVWCRYLCPVAGVFNMLSRLAPISFKTNEQAWRNYKGEKQANPSCPPMINMRQLHGVSACHMCAHCAGYRDAVSLQPRSCNEEVVTFGALKPNLWETRLLLYGMIGVAIGAFGWSSSHLLITIKQNIATWLVRHGIFWPLEPTGHWWVLTNYPQIGDHFNWLDGFCITAYILGSGVLFGLSLSLALSLMVRLDHFLKNVVWFLRLKIAARTPEQKPFVGQDETKTALVNESGTLKFHLVQAYLPLAASGLFLGLSATTVKLLRYWGMNSWWVGQVRAVILATAALWSFYLAVQILKRYQLDPLARLTTQGLFFLTLLPIIFAWVAIFWL